MYIDINTCNGIEDESFELARQTFTLPLLLLFLRVTIFIVKSCSNSDLNYFFLC